MENNELTLKPISALLSEKFFIPGYQRGYRWTKRQVVDLLSDIREFQRESESQKKETFYCLQPLVVRETKNTGEWELIDGQQRLTTIYLILLYLKEILSILGKAPYSLQYETREDSGAFLKAIDCTKKEQNIDYFHICNAYEAITEWFNKQDGTYKIKFLQTLLNDDDTGKNVKVIWYNVKEKIDPVEVFTRLNIGKIPLTNAELVKALILRSKNCGKNEITLQQLRIAQEWDAIEKALQADDFWYFMHNEDKYDNRIQYILELLADEFNNAPDAKGDDYYTFIAFNQRVNGQGVTPETEWKNVKTYFMTLEEWFRDRYFYHLIGYLINEGVSIPTILVTAKKNDTKRAFKRALKGIVFNSLFGKQYDLSQYDNKEKLQNFISESVKEWNYGAVRIKSALLLFNIATLLRSTASNLRFQFDSYKKENWDIEHVRSVKSGKPDRTDLQKAWLSNILEYFTGSHDRSVQENYILNKKVTDEKERFPKEELLKAIRLSDDKVFDTAAFDALYEELVTFFNEQVDRDTDNTIGNMALLDASTNRSYQNAVFPIKRKRILALDKSATFVPVCTKNVFLKYYSDKIDQMMLWGEEDRDYYEVAIIDTLTWFFSHGEVEL